MMGAIKDMEMQEIHRNQLVSYIEMAAHSMVNQPS
jgi:truncated hemoglobin YjbI